ncbi:hypothetical protein GCM10009791_01960 [Citricoccus zhacaiensis]
MSPVPVARSRTTGLSGNSALSTVRRTNRGSCPHVITRFIKSYRPAMPSNIEATFVPWSAGTPARSVTSSGDAWSVRGFSEAGWLVLTRSTVAGSGPEP